MNDKNTETIDTNALRKMHERSSARIAAAKRNTIRDSIIGIVTCATLVLSFSYLAKEYKLEEDARTCQEFCAWQQKDALGNNGFGCVCK